VRMVGELRRQDPADHGVIARVARQLDVGAESLRQWVKQAEVDTGARPGASTAEQRAHAAGSQRQGWVRALMSCATAWGWSHWGQCDASSMTWTSASSNRPARCWATSGLR
jgi:hypothetical protein